MMGAAEEDIAINDISPMESCQEKGQKAIEMRGKEAAGQSAGSTSNSCSSFCSGCTRTRRRECMHKCKAYSKR